MLQLAWEPLRDEKGGNLPVKSHMPVCLLYGRMCCPFLGLCAQYTWRFASLTKQIRFFSNIFFGSDHLC